MYSVNAIHLHAVLKLNLPKNRIEASKRDAESQMTASRGRKLEEFYMRVHEQVYFSKIYLDFMCRWEE